MADIQPIGEKVAVVGTAPSSHHLAPFNDPSWEIWGCSPGAQNLLPRLTRWFEVHDLDAERRKRPEYYDWLTKTDVPVYALDKAADIPTFTPCRREEAVETFGEEFLTSSVAWMLAEALLNFKDTGYPKKIGLFGVDMCADDEYGYQKPGCWFFIRTGMMQGIDFVIPEVSDLHLHIPPYPGKSPLTTRLRVRREETQAHLDRVQSTIAALEQNLTNLRGSERFYEGRLAEIEYWEHNWSVRWAESA